MQKNKQVKHVKQLVKKLKKYHLVNVYTLKDDKEIYINIVKKPIEDMIFKGIGVAYSMIENDQHLRRIVDSLHIKEKLQARFTSSCCNKPVVGKGKFIPREGNDKVGHSVMIAKEKYYIELKYTCLVCRKKCKTIKK